MEQLIDIGLSTVIICLGVYFIVLTARFVAVKVWATTENKWIRGAIKWIGTMWLPIWPIIIGWILVQYMDGIPIPDAIKNLVGNHPKSPVLGIYGAFCGMISAAVVKQVKDILAKKGIDVSIGNPAQATLESEQKVMNRKAEKINGKKADPPKADPPKADPPKADPPKADPPKEKDEK